MSQALKQQENGPLYPFFQVKICTGKGQNGGAP